MNQNIVLVFYIVVLFGYVFYNYMWPNVKEVRQMIQEMQDNKEKNEEEVKDER